MTSQEVCLPDLKEFSLSAISPENDSNLSLLVFYRKKQNSIVVVLEPDWTDGHYCFISSYPVLESEIPTALYAAAEKIADELGIGYAEAISAMLESYINDYIVDVDASLVPSVRLAFENDPKRNVSKGPFVLTGHRHAKTYSQGPLLVVKGRYYASTIFGIAEVCDGIYRDLIIDASFDFPSTLDIENYPIEYAYNLCDEQEVVKDTFEFYDEADEAWLPLNLSRFIHMIQHLYPEQEKFVEGCILANVAYIAGYSQWGEDYTNVEKLSEMLERDRAGFLPS